MTDIAERLMARDWIPAYESDYASAMGPMCDEAAAEIERNRAAIAELVGVLKVVVEPYDDFPPAVLEEIAPDWLPQVRALITKYNHIVKE